MRRTFALPSLNGARRVTKTELIVPTVCDGCQAALPAVAGPSDPPKRFQVVELPPIVVDIVEYQAHARTCFCSGVVTAATIPADLRAPTVGPRLTATLSYPKRGKVALKALLGDRIDGIVHSDRWHVYLQVPAATAKPVASSSNAF